MENLKLSEITKVCSGELLTKCEDIDIEYFCKDTRIINQGDMYVTGGTIISKTQRNRTLITNAGTLDINGGNLATTPYSALASGRLSRLPGEESKRLNEDFYAKLKYQSTENQDLEIIKRVNEIAENYDVSMTEVSLAWLLTKVTSPIVGATKMHHVDGAVGSVDLTLMDDDINYLEEPYVAHDLVGVMADNKVSASDNEKVWAKHTKDKI